MFNADPKRPLVRIVGALGALGGLTVLGWGIATILRRGDTHYTNWFGELVFAPIAILLGLVVILGAAFKPEILGRPPTGSRH